VTNSDGNGTDQRHARKTGAFAELHVLYALEVQGSLRTASLPAHISNLSPYAASAAIARLRTRQHVEPALQRGHWRLTKLGAAHLERRRRHLDLDVSKGGEMQAFEPGPDGASHDGWEEDPRGVDAVHGNGQD
jgi:hypothetical protein